MSDEKKNKIFSGKMDENKKEKVSVQKSKTATITFRGNRKFDLHIGRNMITFLNRQTKQIPAEWLKHKDWNNVSKYFIIKGV